MENKIIGIMVMNLMIGVLFLILGIIKFVNPNPKDEMDLLFGVIYLLSGLTMSGVSIYRLIVKK